MKLTEEQQLDITSTLLAESRRLNSEGMPLHQVVAKLREIRQEMTEAYKQGISPTLQQEVEKTQ